MGSAGDRLAGLVRATVAPGSLVLEVAPDGDGAAAALEGAGLVVAACRPAASRAAAKSSGGTEAHAVDLADTRLADRLVEVAGGRDVGALVLSELLGRVADLPALLDALAEASTALGGPLLAVAEANVGHLDVAAKLATGRWDVTPSGLLASDRRSHFTAARLDAELGRRGWAPEGRADVEAERSDQHFPPDHPGLVDGAPLHDLLAALRRRSGDGAEAAVLVRSYRPRPVPVTAADGRDRRFLTVVVRTQGRRPGNLLEALTCLAAQTDPDFDVRLCVHAGSPPDADAVESARVVVAAFAPPFAGRVEVVVVVGRGRARPLNAGLEAAAGRYVAFLDDDDLVTADWVEQFRAGAEAAPGRVVRSVTVDRRIRRTDGGPGHPPYETVSGLKASHADRFDVLEHFSRNRTPICSYAVPSDAVDALGARFDDRLPVLEDWKFFLRAALVSGVHDTGSVTSVYHWWEDDGSTARAVDVGMWEDSHRSVVRSFDDEPLLLPPGCAGRIALMYEKAAILDHEMPIHNVERAALSERVEELDRKLAERDRRLADLDRRLAQCDARLAERERELAQMRASRAWRLTQPVRRVAAAARRRRIT